MDLPSGTITFLFTDIEGSTRLWEERPQEMRAALARHDALLREGIEENQGVVFKTVGDAFCAAFATAPNALNAALRTQLLLHNEAWEQTGPMRVRMALHTGEAYEHDGDYFGPTLNRVARLQSVGHGQQTLLSQVTYDLVCRQLPLNVTLQDMGRHQLRDLLAPEHIWQLRHPSLPNDFPPLKSLAALPTNLPRQMTSFIGRVQEMAVVKRLLPSTPLLTLVGTGGSGKTRLALQVAADVLDDYRDGVWLAEFAALSDPDLVPQTVATALRLREEPGRPLLQTVHDYLRDRHLLLILDNCEHVVAACAHLADTLLKACPSLAILATSREPLHIAGERPWRVPSLLTPDPNVLSLAEQDAAAVLMEFDACHLFVERAAVHRQDFALTRGSVIAVAHLCRQLDGIPLAIELAASRVGSLSVEEIDNRLDDRFRLLAGGSRTALPRQQTLRTLIDWSYDLLKGPEQSLLQRLSVFSWGWTLEAAEAVCAGEGIEDREILHLLAGLVDKSLVVYEEPEQQGRYRFQETIRQYARDRLLEAGKTDMFRLLHQEFCVRMAEEAERHLGGPEESLWLERLETEHDNLREALRCRLPSPNSPMALRLAGALWRFWLMRGYSSEGREHLAAALSGSETAPPETRAKALNGAGNLANSQGDYAAAYRLQEEALAIRRRLHDNPGIASSLDNLGTVFFSQGNYEQARALYEESLAISRQLGDKQRSANSLLWLGNIDYRQGDLARARLIYTEVQEIYRELGYLRGLAWSLHNLGNLASDREDYAEARSLFEESLTIKRTLKDRAGVSTTLHSLGNVACRLGEVASARPLYEESLAMAQDLGDRPGEAENLARLATVAMSETNYSEAHELLTNAWAIHTELGNQFEMSVSLEVWAQLAVAQGRLRRAARLGGAAEALREVIGVSLTPHYQREHEMMLAHLHEALGEDDYETEYTAGRQMSREQMGHCKDIER